MATLSWAAISLSGCEQAAAQALEDGDVPALAALKTTADPKKVLPPRDFSQVPVPAADGPKLAPLSLATPVYAKPDKRAEVIGYLRLGARVARSRGPIAKDGCPKGWYSTRPVGFVCADERATIDLENPLAQAVQVEPNRSNPMPYKYGFLRSIAPNYLRIPTHEEQLTYEMRLERHLRSYGKLHEQWDVLDVGANDVPLSPSGAALGKIPDHATPMDMSERYGGAHNDQIPFWLESGRKIPNVSSFKAPNYAVIADRVKRHAGVAMIGTFVAGEKANRRRFSITTDVRLIPADKIKASSGSPFHGHELREIGLPVAFPYTPSTYEYSLIDGELKRGGQVQHRQLIPLTGKVKIVRGVRMVETRKGTWLRSGDLKTAAKPSQLPSWAKGKNKWIDVSISSQTLVLWEGDEPIYVTLVSSGRGGLGEPGTPFLTPRGSYRIYQKHVTTTMDSDAADDEFELRDVPWVMYFKGGYALHAAYWHDDFGRVRSHGCINLAPIDARYVFMWSTPQVPEHWHGAYAQDPFEEGTTVYIHA